MVNVSGVVAEAPLPGIAAYAASKAALHAFDISFAREARRRGILVVDDPPPHFTARCDGVGFCGK